MTERLVQTMMRRWPYTVAALVVVAGVCLAASRFIAPATAALLIALTFAAYLVGFALQTTKMQKVVSCLAEANARLEREMAERLAAEQSLQRSDLKYKALFESSSDAIMLRTHDRSLLDANQAAVALFGCKDVAELTAGMPLAFYPERQPDGSLSAVKAVEMITIAMRDGSHFCEWNYRRKDGTEFFATVLLTRMEIGGETLLLSTVRDITQQKQAEEEREKITRELQSLYDDAPCGYHSVDVNGVYLQVNNTELSWLGYGRDELVGKRTIMDLVAPGDRASVEREFAAFKERGWTRDFEFEMVRKDGSAMPVLLNAVAIKDAAGKYVMSRSTMFDMTDRRRLEETLHGSERRHRLFAENVTDVIWTMDFSGQFTYITPSVQQSLGYTPEEMTVRGLNDIIAPACLSDALAGLTSLVDACKAGRTVEPRCIELLMVRKDGSTVWREVTASPMRDEQGNAIAIQGINRDISERKKLEERQRQSQQRLQRVNQLQEELLMQGSFEEKFQKIADTAVELLDLDFCRIWKVEPGDLCQEGCIHAAAEPPHACLNRENCLHLMVSSGRYTQIDGTHRRVPFGCCKIGRIASGECDRFLTNDVVHDPQVADHDWARSLGLVSFAGYRLHDAGGNAIGVLGVFAKHAISEEDDAFLLNLAETTSKVILENEAAETVRRETAKLSAMISGMDEGVVFADARDVIVEVNDFFCRLVGQPKDNILGRRIEDMHSNAVFGRILPRLERFRKEVDSDSFMLQRALGGMEVILRVQPIYRDRRYDGVLLNVINVSELVEARRQAEAANANKSAFLANMSHEIRTPMTAILGYADLLMDAAIDARQRKSYLDVIRRNGEHLLRLINDILDLSKIEAGKLSMELQRWSIVSILGEVACMMRPRIQHRDVSLTVEYPGEIPQTILTDGARVRQALINLVGNAVKFTEHGSVRIVASFVQKWQDGRSAVKIEVIDTGIGIREDVLSQLFQPFFQGEAAVAGTYGGTGLGLAISRHIASMLGGDLTAQSVWGEGSCFTLTIPTGDLQGVRILKGPSEEQERPSQEERREANVSLRGARILLAEDGYDNRELIRAVLRQAGAAVETAEDGGIAVEMAQSKSFDVVLMDMNMPVMDGFEATRLLRSRGYSGPILALTANAMAEDRERCRMAGCNEFLAKPIDRAQMIETIARYVGGGEPLVETPPSSCSVDPLPSCRGGETVPIVSEYAGDPVIAEILGPFIENLPTQVEAMQIARVNGRCDEVQRLAHQLKGAGGGYGFPMLSAACQILEDAARAGNLALGDAAIQQIGVLVEAIQKGYSAAAPAKNATS